MKITIYTTNTCAYCAVVKKYLANKAPSALFEIVNLDQNPERRQEAMALSAGATTVPITVFQKGDPLGDKGTRHTKVVVGWKPDQLAEAVA